MIKAKLRLKKTGRRFRALFTNPFFWVLTIAGNAIILIGSILLYWFESAFQGYSVEFIDCVLWSTGLVTTVGYGSYMPLTLAGKITVLGLMLLGTLFIWSYMVFLVTGLIAPELSSLEKDVHDVEKEIHELKLGPH